MKRYQIQKIVDFLLHSKKSSLKEGDLCLKRTFLGEEKEEVFFFTGEQPSVKAFSLHGHIFRKGSHFLLDLSPEDIDSFTGEIQGRGKEYFLLKFSHMKQELQEAAEQKVLSFARRKISSKKEISKSILDAYFQDSFSKKEIEFLKSGNKGFFSESQNRKFLVSNREFIRFLKIQRERIFGEKKSLLSELTGAEVKVIPGEVIQYFLSEEGEKEDFLQKIVLRFEKEIEKSLKGFPEILWLSLFFYEKFEKEMAKGIPVKERNISYLLEKEKELALLRKEAAQEHASALILLLDGGKEKKISPEKFSFLIPKENTSSKKEEIPLSEVCSVFLEGVPSKKILFDPRKALGKSA